MFPRASGGDDAPQTRVQRRHARSTDRKVAAGNSRSAQRHPARSSAAGDLPAARSFVARFSRRQVRGAQQAVATAEAALPRVVRTPAEVDRAPFTHHGVVLGVGGKRVGGSALGRGISSASRA